MPAPADFDLTLSFDNGPEPGTTPGVLDALARRSLRATFFLIGRKLAAPGARACAERARAEGHWIGNHTWTHSVPLGQQPGPDAAETEVARTQAAMDGLSHPDRLFRPMGGGGNLDRRLLSGSAAALLRRGGYTCVLWNSVPRDWADPDGWAARALDDLAARPWTLIVLHDLPTGAMRHLPGFLDAAAARGARFRQDFPPDCVPLRRGTAQHSLDEYVTPDARPNPIPHPNGATSCAT